MHNEEGEISFVDLVAVLWQKKKLIMSLTGLIAIGVFIFVLVGKLLPPEKSFLPDVYTSTAFMRIQSNQKNSNNALSTFLQQNNLSGLPGLNNAAGNINAQQLALYIAGSSSFLDAIADKFNIVEKYKIKKFPKTSGRRMIKRFLKAKIDDKNNVFSIAVTHIEPEFAQQVVLFAVQYYETRFAELGLDNKSREKENLEKILSDSKKPIIFCEGTSDVSILQKAFEKLYNLELFDDEVKIEGGGGEGEVGNKVRNNKTENVIIGILDNDLAGQKQRDNIIKNHNFREIDSTYCVNGNNHLVILPIPEFRKNAAVYFEKKTFIEYLFSDETLEQKLQVDLTQHRGETFKRFDDSKIDSIKSQIIKNIDKLEKDDFVYFKPLFEEIAEIIKYQLPSA